VAAILARDQLDHIVVVIVIVTVPADRAAAASFE
jgi:hypothetical protein